MPNEAVTNTSVAPWIAAEQGLTPEQRDARRASMDELNIADCERRDEGDHWSLHHPEFGCVLSEHKGTPYSWMAFAYRILTTGRSAKWKTIRMLHTLRQALREEWAQGMGLETPDPGAGEASVRGFLSQARARDRVHHGEETF